MNNWKWCVQGTDGKTVKGWYNDNGIWYYLNDEGIMQTGWIQDKDQRWYYLDESGKLKTGWIQLKGIWFYLEVSSNGYMGECYVNRIETINGKNYSFDSNGHLIEDNDSLVSDKCIDFIKSWEGYFSEPYLDIVGVKTIGYGLTGEEIEGLTYVTEEQATTLLKNWVNTKYAPKIKSDLDSKGISLKDWEFSALVSFAYNCGTDALLNQSTLYKNVCKGIRDSDTITTNFKSWSNAGNKRVEGLYRRRCKEANMFLNADYEGNI